jgi:hypothetical protein
VSVIRWEEPRKEHGNSRSQAGSPWWDIANELRAKPGCWALVHEGKHGTASGWQNRIKKGSRPAFEPAGSFEAVTNTEAEVTKLYARYVGGES